MVLEWCLVSCSLSDCISILFIKLSHSFDGENFDVCPASPKCLNKVVSTYI